MPQYPAMPMFADTWIADTHPDLSLEEQGCYWLLICFAWLRPSCDLPTDDRWIATRLGVDMRTWKRLRPTVLERFWTLADDGEGPTWRQKKQRSVREVVAKSSIANRQAALSRWGKEKQKAKENNKQPHANAHASGYAPAMPPILSNPKNTNLEKQSTAPAASSGRSPDRLPPSAATSPEPLKGQRYFEEMDRRSPPPPEPAKLGVHILQGTDVYFAWWKHLKANPRVDARGGWTFPASAPPGYVAKKEPPSPSEEGIPF